MAWFGQSRSLQRIPYEPLLLPAWQIVELGENEQIFIIGERSVHGNGLRHIADGAANAYRLSGNGETGHARLAGRGRQ